MCVPCTPGVSLQKELQAAEDKFTENTKLKRIRMVERGGTKLKDMLCAKDPWESESCEREKLVPNEIYKDTQDPLSLPGGGRGRDCLVQGRDHNEQQRGVEREQAPKNGGRKR